MDKLSRLSPASRTGDMFITEPEEIEVILEALSDDEDENSGPKEDSDDSNDYGDVFGVEYDEIAEDGEDDYNAEFGLRRPGLYREHKRNEDLGYMETDAQRMEIKLELLEGEGKENKIDFENLIDESGHGYTSLLDFSHHETGMVEYRGTDIGQSYAEPGGDLNESHAFRSGVLTIEYEEPALINGQETYQRIVFEADREGESVYDLTVRKLMDAGIEFSAEYDPDFGSMMMTSIDNARDGTSGNFFEFYSEGSIGKDAADKEVAEKGKLYEWRKGEETSCGGSPDLLSLKNIYKQYSKAQGQHDGFGPEETGPVMSRSYHSPPLQVSYARSVVPSFKRPTDLITSMIPY